jgi:hypothetical protein
MTVAVGREKRNNYEYKKKLTKVLSTKITTEDYKKFRVLTSLAYQYGESSKIVLLKCSL